VFYFKGLKTNFHCKNLQGKIKFKFLFSLGFSQVEKIEDNFYINIHELINIHISADGNSIKFI